MPSRRDVLPAAITAAGATVIVGTFLTWLRSGSTERTSYDVLGLIDRLDLAPDGFVGLMIRMWPLVPLMVTASVFLGWWHHASPWHHRMRTPRWATAASGVLAVMAGVYAGGLGLVVLVASHRVERLRISTGAGPTTTAVGGILITILGLLSVWSTRRRPASGTPDPTPVSTLGYRRPMPTRDEALALLTAAGSPFEIAEADVWGERIRVYPNAPASLRDIWATTAGHGDLVYLAFQDERVTYAEAHASVRKLAARLDAAGLTKGDRVAIGMRNYPEWPVAFWACQSLGLVVVSLNAWWTSSELEYGLTDSGATALIVDDERYERVRGELLASLAMKAVIVVRGTTLDDTHVTWADVVADVDPGSLPDVEIAPDDDATILYTSGTTGFPKGAVGSNRNHITNITNTLFGGALAAVMAPPKPEGAPAVAPSRAIALWTFPFFHIAGVTGICVLTATGGEIITQYKFDVEGALDIIERERATTVAGVPTVVRSLLEHPDASTRDLSSLSGISQGGSPVPPDSIAKIETEFAGKVSPGNGYGLTETTSAVIANSGAMYFAKKDSVGLPVPVADVRVVDEEGNDVEEGGVGELWVRGPNNVRGYWNKPEETAKAFTNGWFHTGDAGRIDEDGFVYVVDRIKDMVLRGGENVYCAEVEAAIFEHPSIADVAVFGVPHDRLGEEVATAVLLKEGATLTANELQEFLSGKLAGFKIPSVVNIRTAELPRNATGKVLKKELRTEYSPA